MELVPKRSKGACQQNTDRQGESGHGTDRISGRVIRPPCTKLHDFVIFEDLSADFDVTCYTDVLRVERNDGIVFSKLGLIVIAQFPPGIEDRGYHHDIASDI